MPTDFKENLTFLGLPNRRTLLKSLAHHFARVSPDSNLPFGFIQININEFQQLNEQLGREIGNAVLFETADILQACLENGSLLFHLGSDNFAVFQPDVSEVGSVLLLANKIISKTARINSIKKEKFEFSLRMGIVFGTGGFHQPETVLRAGNKALTGVNREDSLSYYLLPANVNDEDDETLYWEREMLIALERGDFELVYQPILGMEDSKLSGFEALLRWNHPSKGLLMPAEFLPIAEQTGIIGLIGEWVLKTACQQTMFWQISGFTSLKIAVNFSSIQFQHFNLVHQVEGIIEDLGFDPSLLEIELSETSISSHQNQIAKVMEPLNKLGVSFSLDDFGTGYFSYESLRDLPLKNLKIDNSFVRKLGQEVGTELMVDGLIQMGNFFDINVIAEGVENPISKRFSKRKRSSKLSRPHLFKTNASKRVYTLFRECCLKGVNYLRMYLIERHRLLG